MIMNAFVIPNKTLQNKPLLHQIPHLYQTLAEQRRTLHSTPLEGKCSTASRLKENARWVPVQGNNFLSQKGACQVRKVPARSPQPPGRLPAGGKSAPQVARR